MATATADRLEPLGIGFGVLIALVGFATLVGMPWTHKGGGALLAVGQVLGALSAIGIGAGLAWIAKK